MTRFATAACAALLCALSATGASFARDLRAQPMQFGYWTDGPPQACGKDCRTWVSATGAITAESPVEFEAFASKHDLRGVAIALDSDGGSVLGALALGRVVRRLGMTTTVGKTIELHATKQGHKRARLSPRASCESMCAFVLLAGVERRVPSQARVLVHQIWLGDRRDDPTAANYSAEDLVVVQRDIGRLARYTVEMGGSIDLLEIALKIPPWEPMRLISRDELRGMKIVTSGDAPEVSSGASASASSLALASGARAPINSLSWTLAANAVHPAIVRHHPLTVEGAGIGTFDLSFGCGETADEFSVTYREWRHGTGAGHAPQPPTEAEVSTAGRSVTLKVVSSRAERQPQVIHSVASGRLPSRLLKMFGESGSHSLRVKTTSTDITTRIRIGNAGFARNLPQLIARCDGSVRTGSTARIAMPPGGG